MAKALLIEREPSFGFALNLQDTFHMTPCPIVTLKIEIQNVPCGPNYLVVQFTRICFQSHSKGELHDHAECSGGSTRGSQNDNAA